MARAATSSGDTQNKLVCANVLLSKFADVNLANEDGDTPLIAGTTLLDFRVSNLAAVYFLSSVYLDATVMLVVGRFFVA